MAKGSHHKLKTILKILIMALVLGLAALVGRHLGEDISLIDNWIKSQGIWAPLFFTLAFCLLPLLIFPTDVLCFSAGVLFGFWWGALYATIGILVSASLMFFVARYLARDRVQKIFLRHPRFAAIDKVITQQGIKMLLLLRFIPIPFGPLSYFLGVTEIKFRIYLVTIFGTFTSVLLGVYFGYVAQHVTKLAGKVEDTSALHESLVWGGLILIVVAVILIARMARRTLKQYEVT